MKRAWFAVVIGLGMGACGGKSEAPAAVAPSEAAAAPAAPTVERPPLVAGYEALRDRLADDDLAGAKTKAEDLAKAAASEAAVAEQATALTKAADIEAARRVFGDLSKAYITVLAAKPELAKDLHAFRCPMAEGYQKWVQVDTTMKNPYMGKRMLECGSKVDLVP